MIEKTLFIDPMGGKTSLLKLVLIGKWQRPWQFGKQDNIVLNLLNQSPDCFGWGTHHFRLKFGLKVILYPRFNSNVDSWGSELKRFTFKNNMVINNLLKMLSFSVAQTAQTPMKVFTLRQSVISITKRWFSLFYSITEPHWNKHQK
jgi:hypothetical protein